MTSVLEHAMPAEARGHGKIELFDERTLKKMDEMPFENFVALPQKEFARAFTKWAYGLGWNMLPSTDMYYMYQAASGLLDGGNAYTDQTRDWNNWGMKKDRMIPTNPMTHLLLTDDTAAEAPLTERTPKGNIIGWAKREPYTGADTKRGTFNPAESNMTATGVKLVYDWVTSAANGTFNSIAWAGIREDLIASMGKAVGRPFHYGYLRGTDKNGNSAQYGGYFFKDDVANQWYVVGYAASKYGAYKVDWIPDANHGLGIMRLQPNQATPIGGNGSNYSMWGTDGTYFYAWESNTLIRRYNMDGTDGGTVATTAFGNNFIKVGAQWFAERSDTRKWQEINITTGAWIGSEWTMPDFSSTNYTVGVWTDGTFLYINNWNGTVYKYTTAGVFVSQEGNYSSDTYTAMWLPDTQEFIQFQYSNGSWYNNNTKYGMSLGTRSLLAGAVTKSSLQTMKITYQFDFA